MNFFLIVCVSLETHLRMQLAYGGEQVSDHARVATEWTELDIKNGRFTWGYPARSNEHCAARMTRGTHGD